MNGWVVGGVIAALLLVGWLAQRRGWIDLTNKRRSAGAVGALGAIDEVFAPHRHEIEAIKERDRELPVEAPVPGDGDTGVAALEPNDDEPENRFDGRIRLDL